MRGRACVVSENGERGEIEEPTDDEDEFGVEEPWGQPSPEDEDDDEGEDDTGAGARW
ncbi:hypothetical protein B2J93_5500 [Marssonina coronariae]|uniref:Uncharacterized protein n=1 Tax=Diplocarpon coronariae TaxID=2795749 RepID=A0A218Z0S2_9HELO|nr:hypothetical protein B2J93_5500 [Marssonina coronariae]